MTRRRKPNLLQQLARYRKAITGLIGALGTWGLATYPDSKWWSLLLALATGLGVSQVVNATTPDSQPPDEGAISFDGVMQIAFGIVVAVALLYILSAVF